MAADLATIKALVFDVDGVLTDGRIVFTASGETRRAFHAHDGIGIVLLRRAGIRCAAITSASCPSISKRVERLGLDAFVDGCKDKGAAFARLLADWQLAAEQVAYMGDDLVDMAPMLSAGVAAAPSNANSAVLAAAAVVTDAAGGCGAVRELAEMILQAQDAQILAEAKKCGLRL
ncbi:MAG: HAD hydrolase family protein [Betaproteobacteria bacterium]|nr:HAD hydrolase family protein [Betaproteobacteria bacterium]